MLKKLSAYIENHPSELTELAGKLVSFNTANPPGEGFEKLVDFAESWLKEAGLKTTVFSVPEEQLPLLIPAECHGPRLALFAEIKGKSEGPALCFQGHYDTVPPCSGWTFDPHAPTVKGDRLYGLGATDMKGGLAAMMMACKALVRCEANLEGNIVFAATPDEEYSGKANLKYFLEKALLKANFAIVGEFSGINNLYIGMKGGSWGDITVLGKSAHGSVPNKGVNAFEKMVGVVNELNHRLLPKLSQQITDLSVLSGELPTSTFMLGGVLTGSGTARSMVPTDVRCSFDMRTVPNCSREHNEKMLFEIIDELRAKDADMDVKAEIASVFPGYAVAPDTEFCQTGIEVIRQVTGKKPFLSISSAALETAFFHQFGIPALAYGPGIPGCAHAADEYVRISDMVKASKVYALLAEKLLGNP
jgi:succinyl-diaminopimelate desuccinylase